MFLGDYLCTSMNGTLGMVERLKIYPLMVRLSFCHGACERIRGLDGTYRVYEEDEPDEFGRYAEWWRTAGKQMAILKHSTSELAIQVIIQADIVRTVDRACSLLVRLRNCRPQCFGIALVEAVFILHRAVWELAAEISQAINTFKEKVQDSHVRLDSGNRLYNNLIVVIIKLAAWNQAVKEYVDAHAALSAKEKEGIRGYDREKAKELFKSRQDIYIAVPKLVEHSKRISSAASNSARWSAPDEGGG